MNNKCITLADIDEALTCAELDNLAGVVQEVLIGYWDEVATWPDLPSPAQNESMSFDDAGKWKGTIAMKEGCKMIKFVMTENSGTVTVTEQGEAGGENVRYQLDLSRAKMGSVIFGFVNATRGRRLVLIVKDKNGVQYLFGDERNAARRVAADAATTGANPESDVNNVPIRFQYDCPRSLVYTADTQSLLTPAGTPAAETPAAETPASQDPE